MTTVHITFEDPDEASAFADAVNSGTPPAVPRSITGISATPPPERIEIGTSRSLTQIGRDVGAAARAARDTLRRTELTIDGRVIARIMPPGI